MDKNILDARKKDIDAIKNGVDILVIGGGITGSGVLNVLSSLNVKVALVDANDFAFGTSSRSSKLIHGGLRYLANGQISVVRDSVRERDFLLNYPDLVKREDFFIPLDEYSWSKTSLRFGLWVYSFFSKSIKAKWYPKEEISKMYPALAETPQKGGYIYAEGVVDDSRLVMENILSAKQNNAVALNYAEVTSINFENNIAKSAIIRDKVLGEEFTVPFKMLINSAGPWVGNIFKMMENKYKEIDDLIKMLKLSKGDHIIIKKELFPVDVAIAIRSPIDRRQVFVIPRGDVVIIGTTEIYYEGDISNPRPTEKEINYLIDSVKRYVKNLSRNDVINAYSGIRPLFGKGSDLGKISREYKIIKNKNIINIVGGKITTYRTVAIKLSRMVMEDLGVSGEPGIKFTYKRDIQSKMDEISKKFALKNDDQINYAYDILYESAFHLDDILWRREGYSIFSKDAGLSKMDSCLEVMEKILNYDKKQLEWEKKNYLETIYR
ncbi:MAG: glycerol-3-phosphate dehydrogenase/oxidase [Thermoplasmata archaeon]